MTPPCKAMRLHHRTSRPTQARTKYASHRTRGYLFGKGIKQWAVLRKNPRIHFGPDYRVYFTCRGEVVYLLLLGGDKSSRKRDIKRAIEMARVINEE